MLDSNVNVIRLRTQSYAIAIRVQEIEDRNGFVKPSEIKYDSWSKFYKKLKSKETQLKVWKTTILCLTCLLIFVVVLQGLSIHPVIGLHTLCISACLIANHVSFISYQSE